LLVDKRESEREREREEEEEEDGEADGGLTEIGPVARRKLDGGRARWRELRREGARSLETEGEGAVEVWCEQGVRAPSILAGRGQQ
jgi:hypothetical protein